MADIKNRQYNEWLGTIVDFVKIFVISADKEKDELEKNFNDKQHALEIAKNADDQVIIKQRKEILNAKQEVKEHLACKLLNMPDIEDTFSSTGFQEEDQFRKEIYSTLSTISQESQTICTNHPPIISIGKWFILCSLIIASIVWFLSTLNLVILAFPTIFVLYIIFSKAKIREQWKLISQFSEHTVYCSHLIDLLQNSINSNYLKDVSACKEEKRIALKELRDKIEKKGSITLDKLFQKEHTEGYAMIEWDNPLWKEWNYTFNSIPQLVRIGSLSFTSLNTEYTIPALIPIQQGHGLLYKTGPVRQIAAIRSAKSIILRLLYSTHPGKIELTLIDPIQLGGSVNEFLSLADVDPELIGRQVCSSQEQISNRLSTIVEQIKTIQQVYLKTDFESIEQYNEAEKTIAEPYRIIFIADFPVNFSEDAIRNLRSIALNGPKCGVYPIIVTSLSSNHVYTELMLDLENECINIDMTSDSVRLSDPRIDRYPLTLDVSPDFTENPFFKKALLSTGKKAQSYKRIEYQFSDMLIKAGLSKEMWWKESTAESLSVPMGPSGALKIRTLELGVNTAHSVLCVGRPGSGKSNLMSVIITTLALKYSPEEIQLYLIDLKNGITFKPYAKFLLPHAKTIAIDSDREFALAVLQGLETEMDRRGQEFRTSDVISIKAYREKSGQVLPRILLMVDEFQDLFTQSDNVSRDSSRILERMIREGRQVGIHIFLSTQSLAGIDIPKSILDLISVRIALQCGDNESRIILSHDNAAATLLKHPGEAIYNDQAGIPDHNVRYQVAYYPENDTSYLETIRQKYESYSPQLIPLIFDGKLACRISDLSIMKKALTGSLEPIQTPYLWIGKPVSLDESLSIQFKRQSGDHLSIIGMNRTQSISVMLNAVLSLALYSQQKDLYIYYMSYEDSEADHNKQVQNISSLYKPGRFQFETRRSLLITLENLHAAIDHPQAERTHDTIIVLDAFHRARDFGDDQGNDNMVTARDHLLYILKYGPDMGIHIILRSESVERIIEIFGGALAEFHYRIAGMLDVTRSMQYIDDSVASHISRANRMIFYNSDESLRPYQPFIPYEAPDETLLLNLKRAL